MEKKLLKRMENFKNTPDRLKFYLLKELSELTDDKRINDFLLNVVENEKYDKIRINAVLLLKKFENDSTIEKLKTIYAFEHDKSVRLVIVETLGDMNSVDVDDFFQTIAIKDLNDVIRAASIRILHERGKLEKSIALDLLVDVIQNDSSVFPKQIALSSLSHYANNSTYGIIKKVFIREEMIQMKKLFYRTLKEISSKLNQELDVDEPQDPIVEDTKKARKKRRKERKKKKLDKDDYVYF